MDLASTVTGVLRTKPVGQISFSLDGITVDKTAMESVAKAIENGDIEVEKGDSGAKLGASYDSWKTRRKIEGQKKLIGKITLSGASAPITLMGRAAIYHESVHALMDMKGQKLNNHNHEVIAYIADAMYLISERQKLIHVGGGNAEKRIFKEAYAVVENHKMLSKRSVSLKWSDCDELLKAVKGHSAYR